jgi:RNA polymerase subunit RPABC4/transcription elongation factor Spt4
MAEKMISCKACGKEIAQSAKICPHCGKRNKRPRWQIALIVFAVIVVLSVIANTNGISNTKVSKENYDKIQSGMTTTQVSEIMGKSDMVSESETPGIGKMELWHYQLGTTAIDVTFFNGKVYDKTWTEL